jgi:hypothetical protein
MEKAAARTGPPPAPATSRPAVSADRHGGSGSGSSGKGANSDSEVDNEALAREFLRGARGNDPNVQDISKNRKDISFASCNKACPTLVDSFAAVLPSGACAHALATKFSESILDYCLESLLLVLEEVLMPAQIQRDDCIVVRSYMIAFLV